MGGCDSNDMIDLAQQGKAGPNIRNIGTKVLSAAPEGLFAVRTT